MRIFANCKEAIGEIERDLHEMGIVVHPNTMQNKNIKDDPNYDTKEIRAYSFMILDTSDKDKMVEECLEWCKAEFKERNSLQPINPGIAWKKRADVWEEFLNNNRFDYTYSERMYHQWIPNIRELRNNPDSRQVIIQVHDRAIDEDRMQTKRIPCSMYYQLMTRNGAIDVIYNMRSSDFYTHFKNDIWLACELQKYFAEATKKPIGKFYMFIGSLHMYRGYGEKHVF